MAKKSKKPNKEKRKRRAHDESQEIPTIDSSGKRKPRERVLGFVDTEETATLKDRTDLQEKKEPESDDKWRHYLPHNLSAVDLEYDPDRIFLSQSRTDAELRTSIVCLDARGTSNEEINKWVETFVLNLYAQPEQTSDAYQPLLVVVCDEDSQLEAQDWLDVHIIRTTDKETAAVDLYRAHLLQTYDGLVSAPPTESEQIPEHLHAVDAERLLTDEELDAWNKELERTRRLKNRYLSE